MNHYVDLSYNNKTARKVMEYFAGWNDYFEIALQYARHNHAPYDVALKYIIPIYFNPDEQEDAYHKLLYLVISYSYEEDNHKHFMSYKEWCDVNGYKI